MSGVALCIGSANWDKRKRLSDEQHCDQKNGADSIDADPLDVRYLKRTVYNCGKVKMVASFNRAGGVQSPDVPAHRVHRFC
jgi:hypothetical protein